VNGAKYTYAYNGTGGCNNLLPTSVTVTGSGLPTAGLTTSTQWDCNGGVSTSTTDPNNQVTSTNYVVSGVADPYYRPLSTVDPLTNTTSYLYSPTRFESVMNFNGTVSTTDTLLTTDGVGRQIFAQTRQGQGSSMFDTVQTTYGWSATGPFTTTSVPYSGTAGQTAPSGTGITTTQDDATNRPTSVSNTGGGLVTTTYSQNDVLSAVGPAPTGEHTKQTQTQYDGLGRVTSFCGIESSGGTSCGQNTGSLSGVVTTTAYTSAAASQTVSSTRGSQSRSSVVDGMGRTAQVVTPEGGTWTYTYDSNSSCPSGYGGTGGVLASGQLASTHDPNGNLLCYAYDALNRMIGVNANGTTCRHFYYDNSTGYAGIPTGVSTPTYPNGRMVEAATDSCSSGTLITDEWFSYDQDGNMTDIWELTPHSTQYYHSTATFFANGNVKTVTLASPSLYEMTYAAEGEGRWSALTDTTTGQDIVKGTTFFPAVNPAVVKLTGTTPDNDTYTYDTNTGNIKQFVFTVGNSPSTASLTGTLGWNPNGSLGQYQIADGFNAAGSETCYSNSSGYLGYGYDDLDRLIEFDCGNGNWGQEFSYDQYDNLSKSVISGRNGTTWNPVYSTSPSNNHCNSPCAYDSNGNMTGDGNDVYGWNAFSKIAWTATSGTPTCGTSGRCATYDAFGRMVESSVNSTWKEYWYTQASKMVMAGTTLSYGRWPTSFGTVETVGTTNFDYLHEDWLGNSRIVSNISNNTVVADQAYTPYGEIYNIFGANNAEYQVFAGMIADLAGSTTTPIMWDTPNRELSYAGRWLSPDPLGLGAFDPTNSQNWNRYAYVLNNPLSAIDPLGLDCVRLNDDGTYKVYTDDEDDCAGDSGFYFDGTVSDATEDPNGNVVATVDGKLECSGDSNCEAWNNVASVTVNGGAASQIAFLPSPDQIASDPVNPPITTATMTNVPGGKEAYCQEQANKAAAAKAIPGGAILYQHQFTPEAAAAAGVDVATELGTDAAKDAGTASLLAWLKNSGAVSPQTVGTLSKFVKGAGYAGTAITAYQALKAAQAEYKYCMK
jgi:RHS repeat-associated protein